MKIYKIAPVITFIIIIFVGCSMPGSSSATFYSTASLDGDVNSGGAYNTTLDEMDVGDYSDNSTNRGFLSFDISSVNTGGSVTIENAVLIVYMIDWFGQPFSDVGNTVVDFVDYGTSLTGADYNTATIDSCGTLASSTASALTQHSLNVTEELQDYITSGAANRFRPQFRLRHATATNNDSDTDETEWVTGNYSVQEYRPQLRLTYSY